MHRPFSATQRRGFTLVELLVVIAIIGTLVGLLLAAVQSARESARRTQCLNQMKQIGLGVMNFESANKKLPYAGQCESTEASSTAYMVHSTATIILPFMEQTQLYHQFDTRYDTAGYGGTITPRGNRLLASGAQLHPKAKGRSYDDTAHPAGQTAAKTVVSTFICPSVPGGAIRDPISNYGGFDYMFVAISDVVSDANLMGQTYGTRHTPQSDYAWKYSVVEGCLNCAEKGFERISDGTSSTILCIEDASRSHPSVPVFGSLSTRNAITGSSQADVVEGRRWNGSAIIGSRRVFAWADPDACTNNYSGPSESEGSRVARINQNASPIGGPVECQWSKNNCGPNDEPFGFHPGGVNVAMADGSIRFMSDSIDGIAVKWLVGARDGTFGD